MLFLTDDSESLDLVLRCSCKTFPLTCVSEVCPGTQNGLSSTGSQENQYNLIRERYDGCEIIMGNLEITQIESNWDFSFLKVNIILCLFRTMSRIAKDAAGKRSIEHVSWLKHISSTQTVHKYWRVLFYSLWSSVFYVDFELDSRLGRSTCFILFFLKPTEFPRLCLGNISPHFFSSGIIIIFYTLIFIIFTKTNTYKTNQNKKRRKHQSWFSSGIILQSFIYHSAVYIVVCATLK